MKLPNACRFAALLMFPVAWAVAQPEDERSRAFDILSRDTSEWYVPKSTISFGMRILSSGASIKFGNLGIVPFANPVAPASEGSVDRFYSDGAVGRDAARSNEVDANGNQTSTPGGRYQTTVTDTGGNTVLTGDFLSFTPGQSRNWNYRNGSQAATPGQVVFHSYRATSEGGTASHDEGVTGGIDVQLARHLGSGTGKLQWSLVAGVALTDINGTANGTVVSTLHLPAAGWAHGAGDLLFRTLLHGPRHRLRRHHSRWL
jgi:hypothetical protein